MTAMEITKTDFENIVSVATSSHVEVYEKVEPHFVSTYDDCKASVLGDVGTDAAEDGQHESLTKAVKQWVCLQAFLSVFRQLDLVLTPTGFGVVSTQQMADDLKAIGEEMGLIIRSPNEEIFNMMHRV